MTGNPSENNKLWTGCLGGLVLLNAGLFWCSAQVVSVAKLLYRHVLPGADLALASRTALRMPEGLLMLASLIAVVFALAALGRLRGRWIIGTVFAILLADVGAMLFLAWGLMSPFEHVTWRIQ